MRDLVKIPALILAVFLFLLPGAQALETLAPVDGTLEHSFALELGKRYPGARIELAGAPSWVGEEPAQAKQVSLLEESGRGQARFLVRGEGEHEFAEARVGFSAWVQAYVAIRRLHPGEPVQADGFTVREVNIAQGEGYEYRGVIYPFTSSIERLETRQTILEGQFLMSTAIQKTPDVRKGDSVRLEIISGDLTLSTDGEAEEPAYKDGNVRVMTRKTKRELVGKLRPDGVVEVQL